MTDPQTKVTKTISHVTGEVGRTIDHNGYYINSSLDAFGSVTSVTDSLSNTLKTAAYKYGVAPFIVSSTDMDLGSRSYTVDALGEVTNYTDAKSQSFSITYDALSRPWVRTDPPSSTDPGQTTTWTWGNTVASHNIGQLASVSSTATAGTYSESYGFDSFGRPASKTIALPVEGSFRFDYAYDTNTGLLQSAFFPYGYPSNYRVEVAYTYQHGILSQLSNALNPSTIWWQATTTNPRGQITQENTGDASSYPRIVSNRAYDVVTGWLGSIQTGVTTGAGLQNESYSYDEVGNVIQRQNNNAGLTENFYYDNLYRLDHSQLGTTKNLQMGYDAMGNITSRSDVAAGDGWTYDPTHKHQVTQAGSSSFKYTYDLNGNASTRNGTQLHWTSYNYPSEVATAAESASFDYGPNRQRWRMTYTSSSGTETTYYATPAFEIVTTASGTDFRHFLYANGRPVVVISRATSGAANVRSLLTDHQNSISELVTDQSPTPSVYSKESFTAYGNRREASTWSGTPTTAELTAMNGVTREGYTFQTVLGSMGLNHMNGRVQDAVTGRFLSADPYVSAPGNTQAWNRYSYVNNNPLTAIDPTGFSSAYKNQNEKSLDYGGDGGGDTGGGGGGGGDTGGGFGAEYSGSNGTTMLDEIQSNGTRPCGAVAGNPCPYALDILFPPYLLDHMGRGSAEGGGGSELDQITITAKRKAQSQTPTQSRCWNTSASSTVAASGPIAGPVGVGASGGTGVGFSWGGNLLNSGLFLQLQAAGIVGAGTYAGWSVTLSRSRVHRDQFPTT